MLAPLKFQVPQQNKEDSFEVKRTDVILGPFIGEGHFGTIHKGTFKDSGQVNSLGAVKSGFIGKEQTFF